jgi:NTE family protein
MRQPEISARRDLLTRLAGLPLFAGIDAATLSELANAMQWLQLPGGEVLFEQGEESDALYLLLYGRLAATRVREDGSLRPVGTIAPGECVGEIGLIAQVPRSARVTALRDSELLRLPRQVFERLLARHPKAMVGLARTALRRAQPHREAAGSSLPQCFAVLPVSPGVDVRAFAAKLAQALGVTPAQALVDAAEGRNRDAGWFSARESRARHVFYVGDDDPAWRDRCLRQSDCALLLADGAAAPLPGFIALPPSSPHIDQHLVLQQTGDPPPGRARAWCQAFPKALAHHHLRDTTDLARLARRLSGRAIGLVLSGGGARGFAHIGVVRALRESGMAIDYVGGTSIGAVIGAGVAADWDHERLVETYRQCFYDTNPVSDWTFPFVSLRGGRKVSKLLRQAFGDRDIEDLPIPFFAVSTNLTAGALNVHEAGTLWPALRASCAIPGVLPPVFKDGQVLVDGGVIDNLPVDEMRRRMTGQIVACDVGGNYRLETDIEETELPPVWRMVVEWYGRARRRRRPSVMKILLRAGMVNSAATAARRRKQTALLLEPKLPGVDLLEWREFHRAIDLGYQYTLRQVGGPKDALSAETPVIG